MQLKFKFTILVIVLMWHNALAQYANNKPLVIDSLYSCKFIDWKMQLPKGWFIMPDSTRKNNIKKTEKPSNIKLNESHHINLIALKKDLNSTYPFFTSGLTAKTYLIQNHIKSEKDFIAASNFLLDRVKPKIAYHNVITTKIINSVKFTVNTIYLDNSNVKQVSLMAYIKNYMLYLTWSYDNEQDNAVLMKMIETSKFY